MRAWGRPRVCRSTATAEPATVSTQDSTNEVMRDAFPEELAADFALAREGFSTARATAPESASSREALDITLRDYTSDKGRKITREYNDLGAGIPAQKSF